MTGIGAYTARRTSALSGVPLSTIHWWDRHGIFGPGVSSTKVKLWSYSDLMGLRVIYWLRRQKTLEAGAEIPAVGMRAVRRALKQLRAVDLPVWHEERSSLFVCPDGTLYLDLPTGLQDLEGQLARGELLDLVAPFTSIEGLKGPDLVRPRPELRIVPGKLSGSPHVAGTRVETTAIAALANDGLDTARIIQLYPYLNEAQISDAIALEQDLDQNLKFKRAA
jgi:uncharacterized protein (DUF433 family)